MSPAPLRLVVASANQDKAAEIRAVLADELGAGVDLVERPIEVPEVDETGVTLEENARLKAVALAMATNTPAVADDTGLEVDALDGAPGVFSARFAGPGATYDDNVRKLIAALSGKVNRRARFRTVALVAFPDGREVLAEGSAEGEIASAPRGDGGFGYDPIFLPDGGAGRSFAELGAQEKHAISHRGRALRRLADLLVEEGLVGRSDPAS